MQPFHRLFDRSAVRAICVPDPMGRIDRGRWERADDAEPADGCDRMFEAFRAAWRRGNPVSDLFGAEPLGLAGTVGPRGANRRADVAKVETFLARTGHYDLARTEGPTGYYGSALGRAIERFQAERGLAVDGAVGPDGETVRTLACEIGAADATPAGARGGGMVHVSGYTRVVDGKPVEVSPYERSAPGSGAAAEERPAAVVAANDAGDGAEDGSAPGGIPSGAGDGQIPVPDYREYALGTDPKTWDGWFATLVDRGDLSPSEVRAYQEIFAAEGGRGIEADGTSSGIDRGTIDRLKGAGYLAGIASDLDPKDLSLSERAEIYHAHLDDVFRRVGGSAALAGIGDGQAAAALADAEFQHGEPKGTAAVQRAINAVAPGSVDVDGRMGPKTLDAYKGLSADPETRNELLDALTDERKRIAAPRTHERIDHFRFLSNRSEVIR